MPPPMSTPPKPSNQIANSPSHFSSDRPSSDFTTSPQPLCGKSTATQSCNKVADRSRPHVPEYDGSRVTGTADTGSREPLHFQDDPQRLRETSIDQLSSTAPESPEARQLLAGPPGIARRAKAHVPSACVNCKRKHLACETRRPCNRCIQTGKEATCVDVQHKKRGRPRLREENMHEVDYGLEYPDGEHYPIRNGMVSVPQVGSRKSKSYRELRSQPDDPYGGSRSRPRDSDYPLHQPPQGATRLPASPTSSHLSQSPPTVFLTPDFLVAEHNLAFADALGLACSAKGQSLADLVIPSEKGKIQRLQTALRAEMIDESHAGRVHGGSYENTSGMPAIENLDLGHATAGFRPRSEYWTFRLPKGRSIGFPITLSLARNGGHFIILTLVQSLNVVMQASPHSSQAAQSARLASPSSNQAPRSPRQACPSRPPHHRQSHSQTTSIYAAELSPSQTASSESRGSMVKASERPSLDQYKQNSPLQTAVLPYSIGCPPSSSDSSRSSHARHHEIPGDSLRHLQLPPIRTSGKGISESSRPSEEGRIGHSHDKQSPAKDSPQSGRRKKRQRVEIVDILH